MYCTCMHMCNVAHYKQRQEKPHYSAIEKLLAKKESLRVELSLLSQTQWKHGLAIGWLQNANKLFMGISSELSLLEVNFENNRIIRVRCVYRCYCLEEDLV